MFAVFVKTLAKRIIANDVSKELQSQAIAIQRPETESIFKAI